MKNSFDCLIHIKVKHKLLIYIYYLLAKVGLRFKWLLKMALEVKLEGGK